MKEFVKNSPDRVKDFKINKTVVKLADPQIQETFLLVIEILDGESWIGQSLADDKITKNIRVSDIDSFCNDFTEEELKSLTLATNNFSVGEQFTKEEFHKVQNKIMDLDINEQLKDLDSLVDNLESPKKPSKFTSIMEEQPQKKTQTNVKLSPDDKSLLKLLLKEGFDSLLKKINSL